MSEREEKSCMEQTDPSGGAPTKAADVPDEARAEEERLKAEYAALEVEDE